MTTAAALLRELFTAARSGVDPAPATAATLAGLEVRDSIVLLAVGKAALGMAAGAEAALAGRVRGRVVVVPDGAGGPPVDGALVAAHPVPDARSRAAGLALLAAAGRADPEQEIVALISGGGSALAAVPAGGLTLADKVATVGRLAAAAAPIQELNRVRRHLSAIKGGRLALASRAPVTTLVISDVAGDDLADVASGPTVVATRFADACAVIERRIGWDDVPAAVRRHLEAGRRGERDEGLIAPRPLDRALLVLGLGALTDAAMAAVERRGIAAEAFGPRLEGEVGAVAAAVLARVGGGGGGERILVAGGEPTVILPARPGRGGRAHQLALLLARGLRGRSDVTAMCVGSDGVDGDSGAAGAVIDGDTWDALGRRGVDAAAALAGCDAGPALAAIGAQVAGGPTGVNHADLVLIHRA